MAGSLSENQETERIYLSLENTSTVPFNSPAGKEAREDNNLKLNHESPSQEQFDGVLVQAIDEVLTTLGEPVKNAFYQHLEVDFNIPKNEIPKNIAKFCNIIHKIFGLGACRLERKFMQNLNSKVQANVEWPECEWSLSKWIVMDTSFEENIDNIRKNYLASELKTVI
jgi:hypothetical protein